MTLAELLATYPRIAIGGVPKAGKTTLAGLVADREIVHTDLWKLRPWAEQPDCIIGACMVEPRFLVEGVQVGRALRKGLTVDAVVWMGTPLQRLEPQQTAMAKGALTIWNDWIGKAAKMPASFHAWFAGETLTIEAA